MEKGKYVDGFVLLVPKEKRADYKKMAAVGRKLWMKHGALDYKECVGDDLDPDTQGMKIRTFPKLTGAKEGEEIWFSYIVYKNRKHRDEVNKNVMAEMEKAMAKFKDLPMSFDMKRFSIGGFKVEIGS